jgi:type III pantothenate kinase
MVVIDVGNSRIKWGRCDEQKVQEAASLPLADVEAWARQRQQWQLQPRERCVLAGVNPPVMAKLAAWLAKQGHAVELLDSYRALFVEVSVEQPERVGLDRLLNAVAANARDRTGKPAIVVAAGSAVTVDWIDQENVFRGGAIFPGLRLMALALHAYTAKLPEVPVPNAQPELPAGSTEQAIAAGIHGAAAGGIIYLIEQLVADQRLEPLVYFTGGDGEFLSRSLEPHLRRLKLDWELWPWMTLEGIRLNAARRL